MQEREGASVACSWGRGRGRGRHRRRCGRKCGVERGRGLVVGLGVEVVTSLLFVLGTNGRMQPVVMAP